MRVRGRISSLSPASRILVRKVSSQYLQIIYHLDRLHVHLYQRKVNSKCVSCDQGHTQASVSFVLPRPALEVIRSPLSSAAKWSFLSDIGWPVSCTHQWSVRAPRSRQFTSLPIVVFDVKNAPTESVAQFIREKHVNIEIGKGYSSCHLIKFKINILRV